MARPSVRLIISLFFSLIWVSFSDQIHNKAVNLSGSSPPLLLPLSFSSPKSSPRSFDSIYRRHLSDLPNARMGLYDDLLINGYYTTRLWIGTPPQEFALIVDTGSTVTYVPCSSCEQCGKHQDPRFQPDLSSTYQPVKCDLACDCDTEKNQCTYERRYAEMSSSSGVLGEDLISFGNESELVPQRAVFGCENVETGDLYSQHADGIIGLGRGQLSIVDQLVDKGVISDSFSLCYGGMGVGGGAMILGGFIPPPDMVFSRSDPFRSPYYNIELKELHVAGKRLPLNPDVFDGKHGTVLDSGTTYAYLPEKAFVAFKDAIMKETHPLKLIPGPDPNYKDVCFSGAGRDVNKLLQTFPVVDMVFGKGHKVSLTPENYLFRHTKVSGAYCLGIFQNGKDPTTLLGGIIVRNTLVMYDRENEKIGFWKTNCSELWKTLHVRTSPPPAPAPVAQSSDNKNESINISPAPAPIGELQNVLPGQFHIGHITFDMSFTVDNSKMKPNITELTSFFAHELEVNTSQVHLLNFTSKGNQSFIRWATFPAESADYISNATALSIILRLKEHHMQLPKSFGSYQLLEWKVEPPKDRSWWQKHVLTVVIGVASLVICLLTLGVWLVWRHKRQDVGAYKPVGSIVPEQELQQL
ncbi:Xylanase inhibitor, N-terminal [Dillenia turbinata]|uniref:Xylanase inhibitor, N-terminal n=1 Tax=Dillenia turbinata TaxID=194707 RepID=A0AAN8ZI53_9MAGN